MTVGPIGPVGPGVSVSCGKFHLVGCPMSHAGGKRFLSSDIQKKILFAIICHYHVIRTSYYDIKVHQVISMISSTIEL